MTLISKKNFGYCRYIVAPFAVLLLVRSYTSWTFLERLSMVPHFEVHQPTAILNSSNSNKTQDLAQPRVRTERLSMVPHFEVQQPTAILNSSNCNKTQDLAQSRVRTTCTQITKSFIQVGQLSN